MNEKIGSVSDVSEHTFIWLNNSYSTRPKKSSKGICAELLIVVPTNTGGLGPKRSTAVTKCKMRCTAPLSSMSVGFFCLSSFCLGCTGTSSVQVENTAT